MNLDDTQKRTVAKWIEAGEKLADIQKRIDAEFGLRLTYMEVRFLVDDLKLMPKDPTPPPPPQSASPKSPAFPQASSPGFSSLPTPGASSIPGAGAAPAGFGAASSGFPSSSPFGNDQNDFKEIGRAHV